MGQNEEASGLGGGEWSRRSQVDGLGTGLRLGLIQEPNPGAGDMILKKLCLLLASSRLLP